MGDSPSDNPTQLLALLNCQSFPLGWSHSYPNWLSTKDENIGKHGYIGTWIL